MSKTIKCLKCGAKNPSDMVFCAVCGAMLGQMEIKRRRVRREHGRHAMSVVLCAVVLAFLVIGGLALWPKRGVLGEQGTPQHGRQAALILSSLHQARGGNMELGRDLRESDINGYIRHIRLEDLPFDDLSVELMENRVHVRISSELASWTCAGYCLTPQLSRDFVLYHDGDGVIVQQASMGHLPLPRFLARKAYADLLQQLQGSPELDLLRQARHVILHANRLHITFGGGV